MSNFTAKEIEYLQSQRLGRLATVNAQGDPHVVPVGFRYNPDLDTIDIGGHNIAPTKKFREAAQQGRVAFVVDDVLPPWKPRGIEIRGRAETHSSGGQEVNKDFSPEIIRVFPKHIISWGLEGDAYHANSRKVE